MSSELEKYEDKSYYPQIRAVLNAEKAPDSVVETAVEYCKAAGLDIMRKPIAIISYGGKNEIVFTIQAITTIASRAGWAGSDEIVFSDKTVSCGGKAVPEWGYQVVYKVMGGQRVAFTGPKVYVQERYKNSWSMAGVMAMYQKCILSAALRIAFPDALGHVYSEEEFSYEAKESIDNSGVEALKAGNLKKLVKAEPVEGTIIEPEAPVSAPEKSSKPELTSLAQDAIDALRACAGLDELIELKDSIKTDWGLSAAEVKTVAIEFSRLQKEMK
jgi:hypothetical protein